MPPRRCCTNPIWGACAAGPAHPSSLRLTSGRKQLLSRLLSRPSEANRPSGLGCHLTSCPRRPGATPVLTSCTHCPMEVAGHPAPRILPSPAPLLSSRLRPHPCLRPEQCPLEVTTGPGSRPHTQPHHVALSSHLVCKGKLTSVGLPDCPLPF